MNKIILITLMVALLITGLFLFLNYHREMKMTRSISPSSSVMPNTPDKNSIIIKDYAFSPSLLKIKKGTTVTWINTDIAEHTITLDDTNLQGPKSDFFGHDKKYSYTFTSIGKFKYHCEPHPYMTAEIEVTE